MTNQISQEAIETREHTVQSPDLRRPKVVSIDIPTEAVSEVPYAWNPSEEKVSPELIERLAETDVEVRQRYMQSMGTIVNIEIDATKKLVNDQRAISESRAEIERIVAEKREKAARRRDDLHRAVDQYFENYIDHLEDYEIEQKEEHNTAQILLNDHKAETSSIIGQKKHHISTSLTSQDGHIHRTNDTIANVNRAREDYAQKSIEIQRDIKELDAVNTIIDALHIDIQTLADLIIEKQGEITAGQLAIARAIVEEQINSEYPDWDQHQAKAATVAVAKEVAPDESKTLELKTIKTRKQATEDKLKQVEGAKAELKRRVDSTEQRLRTLSRTWHEEARKLQKNLNFGEKLLSHSVRTHEDVSVLEQLQAGNLVKNAPEEFQNIFFTGMKHRTQMRKLAELPSKDVPEPVFFETNTLSTFVEGKEMVDIAAEVETADNMRTNALEISERIVETRRRLFGAATRFHFGKSN